VLVRPSKQNEISRPPPNAIAPCLDEQRPEFSHNLDPHSRHKYRLVTLPKAAWATVTRSSAIALGYREPRPPKRSLSTSHARHQYCAYRPSLPSSICRLPFHPKDWITELREQAAHVWLVASVLLIYDLRCCVKALNRPTLETSKAKAVGLYAPRLRQTGYPRESFLTSNRVVYRRDRVALCVLEQLVSRHDKTDSTKCLKSLRA
jgi:hypothetical protein